MALGVKWFLAAVIAMGARADGSERGAPVVVATGAAHGSELAPALDLTPARGPAPPKPSELTPTKAPSKWEW